MDTLPDDTVAMRWFEGQVWPTGRRCRHSGCVGTTQVLNAKLMPYRCPLCRRYFGLRTGTVLGRSRVPVRDWAIAVNLEVTPLKSISSMKPYREIKTSQPTVSFTLHHICEGWTRSSDSDRFAGPVEVDETDMGGKRKTMPKSKREHSTGRRPMVKRAVVCAKDRATNRTAAKAVNATDKETLQGFVKNHAAEDATGYMEEARSYETLPFDHEAVRHSVGNYAVGKAHINGVESFWSMLKRAYVGTFHKTSPKHLNRNVQEFTAKHDVRELGTVSQMTALVAGLS